MDSKKFVTFESLMLYDKLIKQYINEVFGDINNNIEQEDNKEEDKTYKEI